MKALVYDGPKTLAFRDVPDPDVKTAHSFGSKASAFADRICMPTWGTTNAARPL
jgi:hypothetical protein